MIDIIEVYGIRQNFIVIEKNILKFIGDDIIGENNKKDLEFYDKQHPNGLMERTLI